MFRFRFGSVSGLVFGFACGSSAGVGFGAGVGYGAGSGSGSGSGSVYMNADVSGNSLLDSLEKRFSTFSASNILSKNMATSPIVFDHTNSNTAIFGSKTIT